MSRGRSMTSDLLTPSATECDETSLAAIWMVCIGGGGSARIAGDAGLPRHKP